MLIDFEVGNYLSFKDPVRLSMVAATPIKEFLDKNTFEAGRLRLLRSAVIYGANASGKSNLLAALHFMGWFVLNSSKEMQVDEEIRATPFKLDAKSEKNPSHFEIRFLLNDVCYRYGFEVDRVAVKKEWLFRAEKVKEEALFLREGDGIEVAGDFSEGNGLEEKTRNNALFLSVAAQFNGQISGDILRGFKGLRTLHGLQDQRYERYTANLLQDESMRNRLVEFIRRADVGIEDLIVSELTLDEDVKGVPEELRPKIRGPKQFKMTTVHRKFRDGVAEGVANLDFSTEESEGTKKFFRIAGPVLDCLRNGYVVAVDELDAKLHPLLTKAIVHLFNSAESNPKNAQLIFVTHDTNLLHYGKLRRDQVWFTEKNEQVSTSLYSLAEFKLPEGVKVRNDAAFEKNYIEGRYGAVPFLGNFGDLFKEE
jgi:AAA15 family ATPase/GTPase